MDSEAVGASETYEELYVSPTCHVQTAESRVSNMWLLRKLTELMRVGQFGAGVLADLKTFVHSMPNSYVDFDNDDDEDDFEEEEEIEGVIQWMELQDADAVSGVELEAEEDHAQHGFPRTASARNNLTALSQRYNVGALFR